MAISSHNPSSSFSRRSSIFPQNHNREVAVAVALAAPTFALALASRLVPTLSYTSSIPLPPKILLLIKQIRPTTSQIHNLRTPIPILLEPRTLRTIERVADPLPATNDAFISVVAETALVADAHERGGADVAVADGAFAVAFVAEAAEGDAGGFAAGEEVGVVAGHDWGLDGWAWSGVVWRKKGSVGWVGG